MSRSDDDMLPRNLWVNLCATTLAGLHKMFMESVEGPLTMPDAVEWAEAIWEDRRGAMGPQQAAQCAVAEILHLSGLDGLLPP